MIENFISYTGTGLLFTMLLGGVLFLMFAMKKSATKALLVWYPLFVLAIYFCPLWVVYMKLRNDSVVLYRILWLIPSGVIIAYAMTTLISRVREKIRPAVFAAGILLIILSGKYVYGNEYFSKAENIYHIPDTVVKICNEIEVPGREVRACFPDEFLQYVRQYTATVFMPYGRSTMFSGSNQSFSDLHDILSKDVIDTETAAELLRASDTPYLIISEDAVFDGNLSDYEFYYVTTIDGYDIFLDNRAYLGLDFESQR